MMSFGENSTGTGITYGPANLLIQEEQFSKFACEVAGESVHFNLHLTKDKAAASDDLRLACA